MTAVAFKTPDVKLEWKLLNATFGGTLSQDGRNHRRQMGADGPPIFTYFRTDGRAGQRLNGGKLSFVPRQDRLASRPLKGELDLGQALLRLSAED
jgi:hypothetical protein